MANANAIINDEMTLEEKLAAIQAAVDAAAAQQSNDTNDDGTVTATEDPYLSMMCDSCQ